MFMNPRAVWFPVWLVNIARINAVRRLEDFQGSGPSIRKSVCWGGSQFGIFIS